MKTNKNIFLVFFIALILMIMVSGCTEKNDNYAKYGDTVAVYYVGTLDDGSVFDQKIKGEDNPLEFVLGQKQMIPGFENAVLGMETGEVKTVTLSPEEAYGTYNPQNSFIANRSQFPDEFVLETGRTIAVTGEDGSVMMVRIANITETEVVLDANHHLAGKNLTFEITLDDIEHPK